MLTCHYLCSVISTVPRYHYGCCTLSLALWYPIITFVVLIIATVVYYITSAVNYHHYCHKHHPDSGSQARSIVQRLATKNNTYGWVRAYLCVCIHMCMHACMVWHLSWQMLTSGHIAQWARELSTDVKTYSWYNES